ncbi:unnamed protein product [Heterobilharzia americana]|nr:unnamed protein product [Heterobilharzia americana]
MNKERLTYTPNYCEENVYKLLEYMEESYSANSAYVVFVSNLNRSVGLFSQVKGDPQMDYFIVWDYHVFLILGSVSKYVVYDFDSLLPFPTPFVQYFTHGLRWNSCLPERLHRYFRVIPGVDYLNHFSSDRSHMQREDGSWVSPPPSYDRIRGKSSVSRHTLPFYWDMKIDAIDQNSLSTTDIYGCVLTEGDFFGKFSDN